MTLEYMAFSWLRFEKRCPLAMFERSPRQAWTGEPDVIGVNKARYLFEIEIKRSVADFKANRDKHFHARRDLVGMNHQDPRYFWFLVPHQIVDQVKPICPYWAGLLRGPTKTEVQQLHSVIPAIQNRASARLTNRECIRLANNMANQIYSFAKKISGWREWGEVNHKWYNEPEYEI